MHNNFDGNLGWIHNTEGEVTMPLIILEDSTMLEFDQSKYFQHAFKPGETTFELKPDFRSCNRPTKIIIRFIDKEYYEEFADGHPRWLKYAEVI